MAVPKRKKSKSKRDKRRTHQKIAAPNVSTCPECGEATLPHHACPSCGYYRGRKVVETEGD
jgi:large subunit ribosomal protein L32